MAPRHIVTIAELQVGDQFRVINQSPWELYELKAKVHDSLHIARIGGLLSEPHPNWTVDSRGYDMPVRGIMMWPNTLVEIVNRPAVASVFVFEFADHTYYGYELMSIHSTKRSAFKAMLAHKNAYWYRHREIYRGYQRETAEIGKEEASWRIRPVELKQ